MHRTSIVLALALCAAPAFAEDLAVVYPVDLPAPVKSDEDDDEGQILCTDWVMEPKDVWNLSIFTYEVPGKVKVALGKSQVIIGHDGTNAVWALVVPDRPGKLTSTLGGDGEKIEHVWLRFHPERVGKIFPAKTVKGNGDPDLLYWAYRAHAHKVSDEFSYGSIAVVPPADALVLDVDTSEGTRRVFSIDMDSSRARYKSGYVTQALPKIVSTNKKDAVSLVEQAWKKVEKDYALFDASPDVDWDSALAEAKTAAAKATSTFQTGVVIRKMLDRLADDDLWVFVGDELVTNDQYVRQFNASWEGINSILGNVEHTNHGIAWSKTPAEGGGIGYINMLGFSDEKVLEELDGVLDKLGGTFTMIVDLRYARYGKREIAEKIAGRFLAEDAAYAYVQKRSGAGRTEFGAAEELRCAKRGPWTYAAPLYVILGPGTARQGEQLALMLARAGKVVTAGSPTLGLNASTERIDVGRDIAIQIAVGRDLDAEGNSLTKKGIEPTLPIPVDDDALTEDNDPVLYRVLEEVLKTPHADRKPGNPDYVPPDPAKAEEAAGKKE